MREPYFKPKPKSFVERFTAAWVGLLMVLVLTALAAVVFAAAVVATAWLLGMI